jgi:hypothetical protein
MRQHPEAWAIEGDTLMTTPDRTTVDAATLTRFWSRVEKTETCWIRAGAQNRIGYNHLWMNGRVVDAHRFALELAIGRPLERSEHACHTCDTPNCVRNDEIGVYIVNGVALPRFGHLFIGTRTDNMTDMATKGRHWHQQHPELGARGSRLNRGHLTDQDILEIRRLANINGMKVKDMAVLFKTSTVNIYRIIQRVTWQHI